MNPVLVVYYQNRKIFNLPLIQNPFVIGRSDQADLILTGQDILSEHAQIFFQDGNYFLQDVNQESPGVETSPVQEKKILKDRDTIQIFDWKIEFLKKTFRRKKQPETKENLSEKFYKIIGESPAMKRVMANCQRVAATHLPVLIQGETGTGKEMIARAIHGLSSRASRPFLALNGSAFSPHLIESELFGHERGAFTGAEKRHLGVFEQANGGTLFLDEIAELPLNLQAKLLRVLEYQKVRRLGGTTEIDVDVRVLTATHRDLKHRVVMKKFREDLFYRLYVLPIELPPLRDRLEDISILFEHFLKEAQPAQTVRVSSEVWQLLTEYHWPGNVRELKNTALRSLAFCQNNYLGMDDIALFVSPDLLQQKRKMAFLKDEEKRRIEVALEETLGNKQKAAEVLGIGRSTLFRKIKQYGVKDPS